MDNFLQAFAEGLDEDENSQTKDESPATRVNVLLRAARRFVLSPEPDERACFEREFEAFQDGMAEALEALEALFDEAKEDEQALLEAAHADLEAMAEFAERLEGLLEEPEAGELDEISQELLVPTYRLLLAQEALNHLGSRLSCPYCDTDNSREAARCQKCNKPLSAPDPLKQEGERFPVPPSITRLLQLCFQVVREPESSLNPWLSHLQTLRTQFGAAREKVRRAKKAEAVGSASLEEFTEMERGLDVMLAGFEELASFQQSREPEILDTGWVNMMSGFKIFKLAGDRLATLTTSK